MSSVGPRLHVMMELFVLRSLALCPEQLGKDGSPLDVRMGMLSAASRVCLPGVPASSQVPKRLGVSGEG